MYFFTLVAFERRNIFCKPDFLSAFKTSIQEVRKQYPFKIIAWVQLPDHLHCILNFEQENHDFSKIWSIIKRKTTKLCPQYHLRDDDLSLSKVLRNEKGIFQRRFYEHLIRNEQDLYNHLNYMHFNPVKHNLVEKTKDWQYSTFHRYVKNGFYDENWGENMDLPHIEDWE
ncbi:Transposase and inactivated derivatives [Alysiella crassa]|uniref:Transposase and inactivated derivatives n=2 Tax=Alysiella crassa TaxID=153491 RepID=A0A376BME8_9NEIS|nr:Transposase and inactivated derivatives [Alysiella crassa]